MSQSNLIELTYYDPKASIRLTTYADTIITEPDGKGESIAAVRFGGYPEMVRAMSDAIYAGGSIDLIQNGNTYQLKSTPKAYRRQLSHDGTYATATLMANDEALSASSSGKEDDGEDENNADSAQPEPPKPRKCYIFCPAGDQESLFAEVDHRTAAPLIPAFRDYVLEELIARKILRQLKVFTLTEKLDAWTLELLPDDKNMVDILEQGLKEGKISIPGAAADSPDGFDGVTSVTSYLNTFGVTVAERIRNQFEPLFAPASEPLSEEVLAVNDYIQQQAGYSLYDAQLAVAEAVKRQLHRRNAAFIVAECGSGKTKIGSAALGALHGLMAAQRQKGTQKTFNLVMCPSHVTRKWVREIGETLPDTYAMVVRSITDLDRLYSMYEAGDKSVFAVFSKERARDGYMRYPTVIWKRHHRHRYLYAHDPNVLSTEGCRQRGRNPGVPSAHLFCRRKSRPGTRGRRLKSKRDRSRWQHADNDLGNLMVHSRNGKSDDGHVLRRTDGGNSVGSRNGDVSVQSRALCPCRRGYFIPG